MGQQNENPRDTNQLNRRRLSPAEMDELKTQLLESIYADIGRSLVRKAMWAIGAILAAVLVGLKTSGKIQ